MGEWRLRRALGRRALAVYGIGGMLGGGIYALVGEVAGRAGSLAWLAFVVALIVAAPTALSYAELAARHPRSGGEARYAREAFGGVALPTVVGWLVLCSGVVSMATLARAFGGYVRELAPAAPVWAGALAFLAGLAALNVRGIRLASTANVVCTAVEAAGLAAVVAVGAVVLAGGEGAPPAPAEAAGGLGVLAGAALAFYAFVGFEDMVNVAEEVREPRRAYPFAVPLALVVVGALYAAVASVSTAVVPPAELAASAAPLTRVVERGVGRAPSTAFTVVALFAVANTALLNFVTASRLLHGMARDGLLPRGLAAVHRSWRTPHRAVLLVLALASGLAAVGGLATLAGATSALLLVVFVATNLALAALRRREARAPAGFRAPPGGPWAGAALSAALVPFLPAPALLTALGLLAAGVAIVGARGLAARSA